MVGGFTTRVVGGCHTAWLLQGLRTGRCGVSGGGGVGGVRAGGFVRCLRTAQWTRASQMFKDASLSSCEVVRRFLGFL
jgi:hypothetical protein